MSVWPHLLLLLKIPSLQVIFHNDYVCKLLSGDMAVQSEDEVVSGQEVPECNSCISSLHGQPTHTAPQSSVLWCGKLPPLELHLQKQACPAQESVRVPSFYHIHVYAVQFFCHTVRKCGYIFLCDIIFASNIFASLQLIWLCKEQVWRQYRSSILHIVPERKFQVLFTFSSSLNGICEIGMVMEHLYTLTPCISSIWRGQ